MIVKVFPKGWRKIVLFSGIFATTTVLVWFGKITADNWVDVTKWSFGFLVAGNVGEHVANRVNG